MQTAVSRQQHDIPVSLAEIHRDCTTHLIPEMISEEDAQEYAQAYKQELMQENFSSKDLMAMLYKLSGC